MSPGRSLPRRARIGPIKLGPAPGRTHEHRGEPVVDLGYDGRLLDLNAAAQRSSGRLFRIVNRRVTTVMKTDQQKFERMLATALREDRPSAIGLNGLSSPSPTMLLLIPILGRARDLFNAISAIVVFIETARRDVRDDAATRLLQTAAGLTARETDVVGLVGVRHGST